jgi:hypothetical protein
MQLTCFARLQYCFKYISYLFQTPSMVFVIVWHNHVKEYIYVHLQFLRQFYVAIYNYSHKLRRTCVCHLESGVAYRKFK